MKSRYFTPTPIVLREKDLVETLQIRNLFEDKRYIVVPERYYDSLTDKEYRLAFTVVGQALIRLISDEEVPKVKVEFPKSSGRQVDIWIYVYNDILTRELIGAIYLLEYYPQFGKIQLSRMDKEYEVDLPALLGLDKIDIPEY